MSQCLLRLRSGAAVRRQVLAYEPDPLVVAGLCSDVRDWFGSGSVAVTVLSRSFAPGGDCTLVAAPGGEFVWLPSRAIGSAEPGIAAELVDITPAFGTRTKLEWQLADLPDDAEWLQVNTSESLVYFQRWDRLRAAGAGTLYCISAHDVLEKTPIPSGPCSCDMTDLAQRGETLRLRPDDAEAAWELLLLFMHRQPDGAGALFPHLAVDSLSAFRNLPTGLDDASDDASAENATETAGTADSSSNEVRLGTEIPKTADTNSSMTQRQSQARDATAERSADVTMHSAPWLPIEQRAKPLGSLEPVRVRATASKAAPDGLPQVSPTPPSRLAPSETHNGSHPADATNERLPLTGPGRGTTSEGSRITRESPAWVESKQVTLRGTPHLAAATLTENAANASAIPHDRDALTLTPACNAGSVSAANSLTLESAAPVSTSAVDPSAGPRTHPSLLGLHTESSTASAKSHQSPATHAVHRIHAEQRPPGTQEATSPGTLQEGTREGVEVDRRARAIRLPTLSQVLESRVTRPPPSLPNTTEAASPHEAHSARQGERDATVWNQFREVSRARNDLHLTSLAGVREGAPAVGAATSPIAARGTIDLTPLVGTESAIPREAHPSVTHEGAEFSWRRGKQQPRQHATAFENEEAQSRAGHRTLRNPCATAFVAATPAPRGPTALDGTTDHGTLVDADAPRNTDAKRGLHSVTLSQHHSPLTREQVSAMPAAAAGARLPYLPQQHGTDSAALDRDRNDSGTQVKRVYGRSLAADSERPARAQVREQRLHDRPVSAKPVWGPKTELRDPGTTRDSSTAIPIPHAVNAISLGTHRCFQELPLSTLPHLRAAFAPLSSASSVPQQAFTLARHIQIGDIVVEIGGCESNPPSSAPTHAGSLIAAIPQSRFGGRR